MTPLEAVVEDLRCPVCADRLQLIDRRSLRCPAGHSFDLARQGYVNLLNRRPPDNADTTDMVNARRRFLASGHYDPIAAGLAEQAGDRGLLLDAGSGPGWYAEQVLRRRPGLRGIALDVSVAAIKAAARTHDRLAAVVADTWQPLPVGDQVVSTLLCVFAPRNIAEFSRILMPSGRLLVVTPRPEHLQELREERGLLTIAEDKLGDLDRRLERDFEVIDRLQLINRPTFDADQQNDVIAMGPNAFHRRAVPAAEQGDRPVSGPAEPARSSHPVTTAVDLTVAIPRRH